MYLHILCQDRPNCAIVECFWTLTFFPSLYFRASSEERIQAAQAAADDALARSKAAQDSLQSVNLQLDEAKEKISQQQLQVGAAIARAEAAENAAAAHEDRVTKLQEDCDRRVATVQLEGEQANEKMLLAEERLQATEQRAQELSQQAASAQVRPGGLRPIVNTCSQTDICKIIL